MSDTSTPETDTYWQNDEYEALRDDHKISRWSDFARKLERERDEAQALANAMHEKWLSKGRCCETLADELREVKQERDEAIEKHRFAVIHWQRDVFKMQRERDEAREAAAKWEAVALREASINGARICAKEDAK